MLGSGSHASTLSIRLVALARHLGGPERCDISMVLPSADKYNDFRPDPAAKVPGARLIQPWQLATRSAMLNLIPYLFTSLAAILRARADIVYLYKPTPITILGLVPRMLFRTPVILDLDDLGSEVMKLQGQSKLQYKLVAFCEKLALRFCSAVVVTSTYLEELVAKQHPGKPILLLPNGVEPFDYTPSPDETPREAVYYFGAINRLDLIEDFLRALPAVVRSVPGTTVTIVGGGSALDEAKKLVRELGVKDSVVFTGWKNDMLEVQRYASFGDLAICCQPDTPTVRAASNMKVFQYMAMSTVPVVSDVGDLRAYVRDGSAGAVVPPNDSEALSKSLIALLKNPSKRARLSRQARHLAEKEYSWESRCKVLESFIYQILPNQKSAPERKQP